MPNDRSKAWARTRHNLRIGPFRNRQRVLILCEDAKSARLYFESFELDKRLVEVLAIGTGMNTDSLVQNAINRKEEADRRGEPFNTIWCVFDRDSFPAQNFNRALQLADAHGVRVAWANEAFELWYLLHFNYYVTGMSRAVYGGLLSKHFKSKYEKTDRQIYAQLKPHQHVAMKHARQLERRWIEMGGCNPESANPSTNIHKLVDFLNQFKDLGPADAD